MNQFMELPDELKSMILSYRTGKSTKGKKVLISKDLTRSLQVYPHSHKPKTRHNTYRFRFAGTQRINRRTHFKYLIISTGYEDRVRIADYNRTLREEGFNSRLLLVTGPRYLPRLNLRWAAMATPNQRRILKKVLHEHSLYFRLDREGREYTNLRKAISNYRSPLSFASCFGIVSRQVLHVKGNHMIAFDLDCESG